MQSNIENLTEKEIQALTKEQIDADNKFRDQLRPLFLIIEKTEQENYRGMEQWQIESMHKLRDQLRPRTRTI